jgi:hemerythrin-like domain-containing protein
MANQVSDTATGVLRTEHQLILAVAHSLAARLAAEQDGTPLDYEDVGRYITFFRLFADACHHGKEEDMLFPELETQGMPHDVGPIAVMLYEHDQGRALVRMMAESLDDARHGDPHANSDLRAGAAGFVDLIVAHIGKEDHVLFNMADEMIVGPDCRDLCARYDTTCGRKFEGRTKQDLELLADEILGKN